LVTGEKILIIEDEQDIAQLMMVLMQERGYQTIVAFDGAEGLKLALNERPDLILLDMRLPKMDGMQVLYRLHQRQANIPVVVVTAWGSEELAVQALRMGVKDYVNKPFDSKELLVTVERALAEGRLRRERDELTEKLLISKQQLERRVYQLTALHEVGQALASTLDPDELHKVILREACRVLEVDEASFFLLDEQSGALVYRSGTGRGAETLIGRQMALGQGIAGWVAEHAESLLVREAQSDPRFSPIFDGLTGAVTESLLCVPLLTKGRVIGVMEALNKPQPGFTEDDLAILRSLAAMVAVSVENARLHRQTEMQLVQTKRAYGEIQALQEITGVMLSTLDLGEVLDRIVHSVVSGLGYSTAMLAEYDEQKRSLPVRAIVADSALIKAGEGLTGLRVLDTYVTMDQTENLAVRAALAGRIEVTHSLYDLFRPWVTPETAEAIQEAAGLHTLATIPLLTKGRLVGNLFAGSSKSQLAVTDLDSLQTLANQAAIAIENARLYQDLRESRDQVAERSEALEKRLSELSRLQQMAIELGKVTIGADVRDVYKRLTQQAATLLETESSAILLFDPERRELICQEPAFGVPNDVIRAYRISLAKDRAAWDAWLSRAAWESGATLVINDVATEPLVRSLGLEELAQRMELHSTLLSMLHVGGQPIGVLQVSDKRDGSTFSPDDERVLEIFASQSAIAIQNARYLQDVRAYQEQQVETERMAVIADIAGNMVHRINNTVGAIRPLVQQIEMKSERGKLDQGYLRDKLGRIRESADFALDLARQLRWPFESVPAQPIDVNASIAAAWADLKTPVGVEVNFEYDEHLPPVKATGQLDEVFHNLMSNALDALAPKGGLLLVRSQRLDDRRIEVTVKDTGPGIPPEIREKIFRVGVTTKPGGIGYGLWWSRMFLRRLGGDMVLESQRDQGCVFTVILPINEE
jgi:GAF domain-containing protein/DNA-binding NarL/FixJ family response regulator